MENKIKNFLDLDDPLEISEPIILFNDTGLVKDEAQVIIDQLDEIFKENATLLALAAPQIGINKRIFGLRFNEGIKYFINPVITKKIGLSISIETCAGFEDREFLVGRPKEIQLVYYNKDFAYEDNKLLDYSAALVDQMCQLFDGVLPTDIGLVSTVSLDGSFEDLTDDEKQEAISLWKQFISIKTQKYKEKINQNVEDVKIYKTLLLAEDIINDRTKLVITETDKAKRNKLLVTKQIKNNNKANFKDFVRSKKH